MALSSSLLFPTRHRRCPHHRRQLFPALQVSTPRSCPQRDLLKFLPLSRPSHSSSLSQFIDFTALGISKYCVQLFFLGYGCYPFLEQLFQGPHLPCSQLNSQHIDQCLLLLLRDRWTTKGELEGKRSGRRPRKGKGEEKAACVLTTSQFTGERSGRAQIRSIFWPSGKRGAKSWAPGRWVPMPLCLRPHKWWLLLTLSISNGKPTLPRIPLCSLRLCTCQLSTLTTPTSSSLRFPPLLSADIYYTHNKEKRCHEKRITLSFRW